MRYGITPQITPADLDDAGARRRARRAFPARGVRGTMSATVANARVERLRRLAPHAGAARAGARDAAVARISSSCRSSSAKAARCAARCRRCPACISSRWTRPCAEARRRWGDGVPAVLLFGLPHAQGRRRDRARTTPTARCRKRFAPFATRSPEMVVITDVCLCEYTSHGHCGIVADGDIANDATVEQLVRAARLARRGRRAHRRAVGHDGRPRRRHPAGARRTRLRPGRDHGVRGEVLLRLLRTVSRGRRLDAAVRRPPQPPDGSRPTPTKRCAKSSSTSTKAPTS